MIEKQIVNIKWKSNLFKIEKNPFAGHLNIFMQTGTHDDGTPVWNILWPHDDGFFEALLERIVAEHVGLIAEKQIEVLT